MNVKYLHIVCFHWERSFQSLIIKIIFICLNKTVLNLFSHLWTSVHQYILTRFRYFTENETWTMKYVFELADLFIVFRSRKTSSEEEPLLEKPTCWAIWILFISQCSIWSIVCLIVSYISRISPICEPHFRPPTGPS